jgi:hypothetical protein
LCAVLGLAAGPALPEEAHVARAMLTAAALVIVAATLVTPAEGWRLLRQALAETRR